nr:hypothetical protein [Tanacetum cinerariifolium]
MRPDIYAAHLGTNYCSGFSPQKDTHNYEYVDEQAAAEYFIQAIERAADTLSPPQAHKELEHSERNDSLHLVNKRLEEFYGPLYFIVEAGEKSFRALQEHIGKTSFRPDNLTESEYKEWRTWYIKVLHPQNLQKEKIIIEKSYLIDGDKIPPCLVDFISHISFYKAIIERWDNNDFSISSPLIVHPESPCRSRSGLFPGTVQVQAPLLSSALPPIFCRKAQCQGQSQDLPGLHSSTSYAKRRRRAAKSQWDFEDPPAID